MMGTLLNVLKTFCSKLVTLQMLGECPNHFRKKPCMNDGKITFCAQERFMKVNW